MLFDESYRFAIGRGVVLKQDGFDAILFAAGPITGAVLEAAPALASSGVCCTVIEMPTLKPFDRDLVKWARERGRAFFTIEEHSVVGGLGTAVMEVLSEEAPAIVYRIGTPDAFLESGSPSELRQKHGLTAHHIVERVLEMCGPSAAAKAPGRSTATST
jgi:transketolase